MLFYAVFTNLRILLCLFLTLGTLREKIILFPIYTTGVTAGLFPGGVLPVSGQLGGGGDTAAQDLPLARTGYLPHCTQVHIRYVLVFMYFFISLFCISVCL